MMMGKESGKILYKASVPPFFSGDANVSCSLLGIAYKGLAASMSNTTSNFSGYPSYVAADVVTTSVICNDVKKSTPSFYKKTLITVSLKNEMKLNQYLIIL